ncbi:type I-E CRISPR-associated protein Cas5/CasD [Epidermidibacterium keratini]
MQAWGDSSRYTRRDTRSAPTKSGIIGLLAAAQGRRRTDPIEDLAELTFGVRIDQRGRLERDFQTARSLDGVRRMPLSYRYFLSDATFIAAVEGSADLIGGLAAALDNPTFPLYLGRRAYHPAAPLKLSISNDGLLSSLRAQPWAAPDWYRAQQGKSVHLELVVDSSAAPDAPIVETVRDVPQSFDPTRREYGWRDVANPEPVVVTNDQGRNEPDFMAVYGGA